MLDPTRPYLFAEVIEVVLRILVEDDEHEFWSLLRMRADLLCTTHWVAASVCRIPAFWTCLLVTTRVPLSKLLKWTSYSDEMPLEVVFRLFSEDEVEPLLSHNEVISLEDYTIDAARIISLAMDRCTSLVVEVESHELLEDILLSLTDTAPLHLNAFVVSFGIKDSGCRRRWLSFVYR